MYIKARIPRRRHRHRHPRRHSCENRRENVGVGVVECGLYASACLPQYAKSTGHVSAILLFVWYNIFGLSEVRYLEKFKTRNACKTLAFNPPGIAMSPVSNSIETKPCIDCHNAWQCCPLANVVKLTPTTIDACCIYILTL